MATLPTYVSREQFMAATDTKTTSNLSSTVDRILQGASRLVEQRLHRRFYPSTEARTIRPRWDQRGIDVDGVFVWLDDDLISITTLVVDGNTISASLYSLDAQEADSYSKLRYYASEMVITGVWGYSNTTVVAGALAEALDSSETGVDVTNSSLVGVGDLIKADSERMVVTEKSLLDTTADLNDTLTADASDVTVTVTNGALILQGETITIDSERMAVRSITGNDLSVERAVDGSVLAAHSGAASVYAPRTLTVERGAVGTTAASHDTAAPLTRNVPPGPIMALCLAEALTQMSQEQAGFALTIGSGEGQMEASGKGLGDLRRQTESYRRFRIGAV